MLLKGMVFIKNSFCVKLFRFPKARKKQSRSFGGTIGLVRLSLGYKREGFLQANKASGHAEDKKGPFF